MKPKSLSYLLFSLVLLAGAQGAMAQEPEAPHDAVAASEAGHAHGAHEAGVRENGPFTPFEDLVEGALDDHPSVLARLAQVDVERKKTAGVGLRPDPMVSLSAEGLPWSSPTLSSGGMAGIHLGISQPLWWPGELAAMKKEVDAQAQSLVPLADERQIELIIEAANLYYDIYEIDRSIEALAKLKAPVNEFLRLLTARLSTGKASVAQIERVRLQLLGIDDRLFLLHHQRPEKVARLNAVLNRPDSSPVNPPPEHAHLDAEQPLPSLGELVEMGMRQRPVVDALKLQKEAALAQGRTARYARYPRLTVFGGWMFRAEKTGGMADDGTDTVSVGISSTLPIWSGDKADVAEDVAQARVVGVDAALAEFRLKLRGEIAANLARLHHFQNHARYYRDTVIPQAEQARKAALAGFQVGRASYEDWVQGEEEIIKLKIALVEFEAGVRKQRALTLALVGQFEIAKTSQHAQENHDGQ